MKITPIFNLHIESGIEGGSFYSKTYVSGFEYLSYSDVDIFYSLNELIQNLQRTATLSLIQGTPTLSSFPFNVKAPNINQIKLYDLHMECGDTQYTSQYSRVVLRSNGGLLEYARSGINMELAIYNLISSLDSLKLLEKLRYGTAKSELLDVSPIISSTNIPQAIKKKEAKRYLPSHIIDVPHPDCQDVCTSMDIFGKAKCKNICEWRKL